MGNKLEKSVSIVGVGCTPFGDIMETPSIQGLTLQELAANAAHEALADARMSPKDLDAILIGNVMTHSSQLSATHTQISHWIGADKAAGVHIDAACSTTNVGATLAAMGIAAGTWDRVLVLGVEATRSMPKAGSPFERQHLSSEQTWLFTDYCMNQAYNVPQGHDVFPVYMGWLAQAYMRKHHVAFEDYDRGLYEICRVRREMASLNEKAFLQEPLESEADRLGFASAFELWTSRQNPFVSWPARYRSVVTPADGASAMVLTRTSEAKNFNDVPVELLGFGTSATDMPWFGEDPTKFDIDRIAFEKAYAMANIRPRDIDWLHVHDCSHVMGVINSELSGYIPEGQYLNYALEGRIRFDGDKPMSTHGGRHAFGHAWAASAGSDTYEAVKQMRGLAGARQINHIPEIAVVQTQGYALLSNVLVLRRS